MIIYQCPTVNSYQGHQKVFLFYKLVMYIAGHKPRFHCIINIHCYTKLKTQPLQSYGCQHVTSSCTCQLSHWTKTYLSTTPFSVSTTAQWVSYYIKHSVFNEYFHLLEETILFTNWSLTSVCEKSCMHTPHAIFIGIRQFSLYYLHPVYIMSSLPWVLSILLLGLDANILALPLLVSSKPEIKYPNINKLHPHVSSTKFALQVLPPQKLVLWGQSIEFYTQ